MAEKLSKTTLKYDNQYLGFCAKCNKYTFHSFDTKECLTCLGVAPTVNTTVITKQCQHCNSKRLMNINAHCSDSFSAEYENLEYDGYVLEGLNFGSSDDVEITFCCDCGRIQGNFPLTHEVIVNAFNEDVDEEEDDEDDYEEEKEDDEDD